MMKGMIFILSGPSGSGKTTLYRKLLASRTVKKHLGKSVSVTTRPKREGEKHGRDYFFVSRKMFQYKKRNGHFFETERVFDNYYGTPKKMVRELLKKGKNVLLCIDVKGAKTIHSKFPKAVTIFVKTPSPEVLAARLKGRGSEKKDTLKIRLKTAREELKAAKRYEYVIVNDNLGRAYRILEEIVRKKLNKDTGRQELQKDE